MLSPGYLHVLLSPFLVTGASSGVFSRSHSKGPVYKTVRMGLVSLHVNRPPASWRFQSFSLLIFKR